MKTLRPIWTLVAAASFSGCALLDLPVWTAGEVPFVPTPIEVVDRMLELAEVKPGDVLYDVGSGDGRIVIRAAKKYGVRAVGIEIDGELVDRARSRARDEGVADRVEFREQDALTADISEATVVTLYMLPEFNFKLRPKLAKLKPGARVVSHDFGIEGWPPERVEKMADKNLGHFHTVYLWKIP
jgi:SAM-dependent methyltransferase